jgi:hypothetical protein
MSTRVERMLSHAACLHACESHIEDSYLKALQEGGQDPVVLLFVTTDETTIGLLETIRSGDEIAALLAEGRRRGARFVSAVGVERALAVGLLEGQFPAVASALAAMTVGPEYYPVVTLAHGAALGSLVPRPALES